MSTPDATLITGASGFIGRRLLRSSDYALVRRRCEFSNSLLGDLLDPSSLAIACRGIHTIFHCAGHSHALDSAGSDISWRVNFEGTRNLLHAAEGAGVRRFVFFSSVKAMADPGESCAEEDQPGQPNSVYGRAKRAAEEAVLEFGERRGVHVVNLRLAMVYGRGGRGNLEKMGSAVRQGWFPPIPETGNRRSLVHVEDVIDVARLVANLSAAKGKTYIVAEDRAYSGREIYDVLRSALGKTPTNRCLPEGIFRTAGRLGDLCGFLTSRPFLINSEVVDRLFGSAFYSPRRIARELGWRAKINLEYGVREMFGECLAPKSRY